MPRRRKAHPGVANAPTRTSGPLHLHRDASASDDGEDNLPPRAVLLQLADLERRGLLTAELVELAGELARAHGLRVRGPSR